MVKYLGLACAVILPLWNIPLIWRIEKRRSSEDISLYWALGVWVCLLGMFPSGIVSSDMVYRTFSVVNLILFTVVMVEVVRFRKKPRAVSTGGVS